MEDNDEGIAIKLETETRICGTALELGLLTIGPDAVDAAGETLEIDDKY
jgi:hypothetical protein